MSDKELLKKCAQGCSISQMEIYDRHYRAVYSSAVRLTKDSSCAEEIVQDCFIKLFRTAQKLKDEVANIVAWLRRTAINAAIDHLRTQKIEFTDIDNSLYFLTNIDTNHDREVDTTDWRVDEVRYAIENLPPGYRTIVTLKLYEGLDFNEISTYLSITESTVRSQYSRAKQKLIEQIER